MSEVRRGQGNPLAPRVTVPRIAGALAVLTVATAILYLAGVEMRPYLTGLAAGSGLCAAALVTYIITRKRA